MFGFLKKYSKERLGMTDVILNVVKIRNIIENYCIRNNFTGTNRKELTMFAFAIWSYLIDTKSNESIDNSLAMKEACRGYLIKKANVTHSDLSEALKVYGNKIENINICFDENVEKYINNQNVSGFEISCYKLGKTFLTRFMSKNTSDHACISVAVHAINGSRELFKDVNLSSVG